MLSRQEWLFYWLRKIALMSLICSNRATWIFFSRWLDLRIHEEEQALHLSGDQMCEDFTLDSHPAAVLFRVLHRHPVGPGLALILQCRSHDVHLPQPMARSRPGR